MGVFPCLHQRMDFMSYLIKTNYTIAAICVGMSGLAIVIALRKINVNVGIFEQAEYFQFCLSYLPLS